MIPIDPHQQRHTAEYDENGNIIIPSLEHSSPEPSKETQWTVKEEEVAPVTQRMTRNRKRPLSRLFSNKKKNQLNTILRESHRRVVATTNELLEEGSRQYSFSFRSLCHSLKNLGHACYKSTGCLWRFLTQPVWIVRKDKEPKQYNRGTLFLLDTVRFGGTFAAIFVALFVALNYQSFWQILTPYLDPIEHARSQNTLASEVNDALKQKLMRSPALATAGSQEGDLLSYLPAVGPPENRIIIPKLKMNVPLVTPSFDSLLREDWVAVEEDIQEALQYGIVHYPGTARPGQAGNFFVTGHSSYYPWAPGAYKTVFARLHELDVGDEYWVYYGGDKHRYIITEKKEVKPSNVTVLDQPTNKRISTLMTCTPVGTTLRRLIITAQEVDPATGIAMTIGQKDMRVVSSPKVEMLPI